MSGGGPPTSCAISSATRRASLRPSFAPMSTSFAYTIAPNAEKPTTKEHVPDPAVVDHLPVLDERAQIHERSARAAPLASPLHASNRPTLDAHAKAQSLDDKRFAPSKIRREIASASSS
jgi:hypothetical protein